MLVEQVKELTPLNRFLYWIREREQVRLKKIACRPKPWTDDTILQSYYFTNVQREHDKVTMWFRDNIREPMKNDPAVVFATIAFRWFNWPATGRALLCGGKEVDCEYSMLPTWVWDRGCKVNLFQYWNTERALSVLGKLDRVFTGAFNISNSGSTKPKINRVCEDYIQPVWEKREELCEALSERRLKSVPTVENAFKILRELPGLGGSGFMAGQVLCDLAYTHVLEGRPDWMTWCTWGPGSKKGMNRVCGCDENCAMSSNEWHVKLEHFRQLINAKLNLPLHARDVQNCLCEFSKYERGLWGEGHLKRRYAGS